MSSYHYAQPQQHSVQQMALFCGDGPPQEDEPVKCLRIDTKRREKL
jgi:hypothetical protein